jgi:hypothetical protein
MGMMSKSVALYREDELVNEIEEWMGINTLFPTLFFPFHLHLHQLLYYSTYIQNGPTDHYRQRWIPTEPGPDHMERLFHAIMAEDQGI